MKKTLSLVLMLALFCTLALAFPLSVGAIPVSYEVELRDAITNGYAVITIIANISLTGTPLSIPGNTLVEIQNNGTLNTNMQNLTVEAGATINVLSGGRLINPAYLVNDGTINIYGDLNNGGELTNNSNLFNYGSISNIGKFYNLGTFYNDSGNFTGDLPPFITTNDYQYGIDINEPYSLQLEADNNPISWGETNLASGNLSLNPASGLISGTPTAIGRISATITATNNHGSDQKNIIFIFGDSKGTLVLSPFPTVTDNTVSVSAEIDMPYSSFQDILFINPDGSSFYLVYGQDFTAHEGSTVVTLLPAFLQTLSNDTYEVSASFFPSGTVPLQLVVNIPLVENIPDSSTTTAAIPQTGDTSNMPLWITFSGLALLGLAGLGLYSRKKRVQ